jgi:hypothetical protein
MQRLLFTAILGCLLSVPASAFAATYTAKAANLRRSPDLQPGTVIRTLPAGETLEVREQRVVDGATWLQVAAGTETGWIREDLTRTDRPPAAPQQPATAAVAPVPDQHPAVRESESLLPVTTSAQAPGVGSPTDHPASRPAPADGGGTGGGLGNALARGLGVSGAEAAVAARPAAAMVRTGTWPVEILRHSQILLAAMLVSFVLMRMERRLEHRWETEKQAVAVAPHVQHLDNVLANEGVRREYDRLVGSLYAIERLLTPNGNGKSALAYLTELVATANTSADARERIDTLKAIRKRMLDTGMLPAFSRAFDGLHGYAFTADLREKVQAFLVAPDGALETCFNGMREATKLCFDDLGRHLVCDVLQGGTMTFLFSRRLDLLEKARATAQSASARGWTVGDLRAVRQTVVRELLRDGAGAERTLEA